MPEKELPHIPKAPLQSLRTVTQTVEEYLDLRRIPQGELVVIAFSGGADSTALLKACLRLDASQRIQVHAVHLDHALDSASAARAQDAESIASSLKSSFEMRRIPVLPHRKKPESLEATARRIRYAFLEEVRLRKGASLILTAHHQDDQEETALLRLGRGTDLFGLGAIRPSLGPVGRPLLSLDRHTLVRAANETGPAPIEDTTNADLGLTRNKLRHKTIPHLKRTQPKLSHAILGAVARVQTSLPNITAQLHTYFHLSANDGRVRLRVQPFRNASPILQRYALGALHRLAGNGFSPSRKASLELCRQLKSGHEVLCSAGGSWRWRVEGEHLFLEKTPSHTFPFEYNLLVPGEVEVTPIQRVFSLRFGPTEEWIYQAWDNRAALNLPLNKGDRVVIRNRRSGDRFQPLGCPYERKLSEILIDAKISREKRDRLPLLVVEGKIAWVPGVTISEGFRLSEGQAYSWIPEIRAIKPNLKASMHFDRGDGKER